MVAITVKDVPAAEFVVAYSAYLKRSGKLEVPKWTDLVKTGKHKELAPYDHDWFYTRAASVARHIYLRGGVGIGALTKVYGGPIRKGHRTARSCRGSASIARHALHALEKMGILEKDAANGGRRITHEGQRELDRIASQVGGLKK